MELGVPIGTREFRRICELVRARAGIELNDSKRQLCQTRLARRLRALGLASYAEYVRLLEDPSSPEHRELVNAITTNVTAFFREAHHFDQLGTIVRKLALQQKRIRIWSAGCSSGEEPWSIAITVREALGARAGLDLRILATDIDTDVVARATEGVYTEDQIAPVGPRRIERFFTRDPGSRRCRIADELRPLVTFKQLNLFDRWPMQGPFDVIFCRNVIIYFDTLNKTKLLRRYHALLAPNGHLMLGHSESITAAAVDGFSLVGRTAYQRTTG